MTRVCLVGSPDVNVRYELLSRETSREALATYQLERPFENTLALRTVSVGAAVSLLNDLQWYLVRFVDEALVLEPSVSETEWLSRELAEALRNGDLEPGETGEYLKVYGVEYPDPKRGPTETPATDGGDGVRDEDATTDGSDASADGDATTDENDDADGRTQTDAAGRLVEPLYVRRTDGEVPTYDLRDVDETLVVRLTEAEYTP